MSDEAFLSAIRETPDDDAPRLIYADWLDDHGQPDRAEIIRLQCRLAALPEGCAEATNLAKREKALLKAHGAEWGDTHLGMVGELRRGFIEHVTTWPHNFIESGGELVEKFPVRSLRLRVDGDNSIRQLAEAPHLARITHLSFEHAMSALMGLGDAGLRALLTSPYLGGLRTLDLKRSDVGQPGVSALAEATQLRSLLDLELASNNLMSFNVSSLASSPVAAGLRYLGLSRARLGPEGAEVLASSRQLRNLRALDLTRARIQARGVQALTQADFLAGVEVLRLGWNGLAVRAAQMLAKCPHLTSLRELDLARNHLADSGATALASLPHLAGLRRLNLRSNKLTAAGVAALGESKHLAGLERLDLARNDVPSAERKHLRALFGKHVVRF